jgi:hypothetical protein
MRVCPDLTREREEKVVQEKQVQAILAGSSIGLLGLRVLPVEAEVQATEEVRKEQGLGPLREAAASLEASSPLWVPRDD